MSSQLKSSAVHLFFLRTSSRTLFERSHFTRSIRFHSRGWKRNISRAMFSRVSCVLFFSFFFFFFKRNCYMRFWESWDGFMVRDSSDWRKCGKRWVEICFREIKMKVWELGNYYYYFKIYLWYLGISRVDFVPWKFAKYTIFWCFEFC